MTKPEITSNRPMEIDPQSVRTLLDAHDGVLLLDCRQPNEHEFAHIDGDRLIPLNELPTRLDELADDRERRIVVYCHTGRRSLVATSMLRHRGFNDAQSMAGGIHRWSLGIDPSIPTY